MKTTIYNSPKIELIDLKENDIITTSNGLPYIGLFSEDEEATIL